MRAPAIKASGLKDGEYRILKESLRRLLVSGERLNMELVAKSIGASRQLVLYRVRDMIERGVMDPYPYASPKWFSITPKGVEAFFKHAELLNDDIEQIKASALEQ